MDKDPIHHRPELARRLARRLRALQRIKKAGAKGELAEFKGELGFELETVG